jgi:hypothetical protein
MQYSDDTNFNFILNRENIVLGMTDALNFFNENKNDLTIRRGIYVHGNPGVGKTEFVIRLLTSLNYDIVKYDAGDIRNKSIIDLIIKHNVSEHSILSMFQHKPKRIAIVMDEIDGMNSGDKGGINTLIKLMRPKKTKKQRQEDIIMNPIICIGSHRVDKKIKELMKVCVSFEIPIPTLNQMETILKCHLNISKDNICNKLAFFIQGDLRKVSIICNIMNKSSENVKKYIIDAFEPKTNNEDSKTIIKNIINSHYNLNDHSALVNETDRTIVGLLWHENIIDVLSKLPSQKKAFLFYKTALDNICFADYIDRVTFQKQIWQFNEMSSLIKTFYNNKLYHDEFESKCPHFNPSEVRFTKVLTKYSTEYNNTLFIQFMCQKFGMDKKDLFSFFSSFFVNQTEQSIQSMIEDYEITKLDIQRMQRYLNNSTIPNESIIDIDVEEDEIIP